MRYILFLMLCCASAFASPITIQDNYVGLSLNSSWKDKDVIGSSNDFNISSITLDYEQTAKHLSVSIFSDYLDNVGKLNTQLGDLFLSDEGWNPVGEAPYLNDTHYANKWNYAIVLDNHLASSGSATLYKINESNIKLSWAQNGYIYRENQAVQATNLDSASIISTGNWSINNNILNLTAGFGEAFNSNSLTFHWGMTCANDIIEGKATFSAVPEPSVALLFLLAFAVLVFARRYNFV